MRPGPQSAKSSFLQRISVNDAPKAAVDWLVEISLLEGWHSNEAEAYEAAERWTTRFLNLLRRELSEFTAVGRFVPFVFNSSSEHVIQGCAYIEPWDTVSTRENKKRLSTYSEYVESLDSLRPRQFEAMCVGLLDLIGVADPKITQYSADEGIDFYGKLDLEQLVLLDTSLPNIQRQLSAWMIGQAKHYKSGQVSTFEIRDLVGAVELARGKAFGSLEQKYVDLDLKACDPVFYLFFTTGRITANTWRLLDRSGVAGMDGEMVAALLAEKSVGVEKDVFSETALYEWISRYESVTN